MIFELIFQIHKINVSEKNLSPRLIGTKRNMFLNTLIQILYKTGFIHAQILYWL